ncbi:hypothetical protein [Litoreibacter roseus]|uniref:Uncharacterized protein n=1 Tax=Litoreibacter roseus TaxID=2601869 RepID=A0A6N6JCM4_9RHOB|nr:hypothetical protein [Litoreibacter roseus]GFE63169.1 hypothetical protein KIN_02430 [Litoreibacter roseus]
MQITLAPAVFAFALTLGGLFGPFNAQENTKFTPERLAEIEAMMAD